MPLHAPNFHVAALSGARDARLRDIGPKPELPDACELDLECPITVELFVEPVLSRDDGHTYDKSAFTQWVLSNREPTSPLTRAPLTLAKAWLSRRHTPPDYYIANDAMRARVQAYRDESETFEARLASWEEAHAQLAEDMALLAVMDASRAEAAAASAPSAPPFALSGMSAQDAAHPWMHPEAAPFGNITRVKSKQKQTAKEYAKRAEDAHRVGDLPEALRWLDKAIQRAPEDNDKLLRLVRIFVSEGRVNEALMWLHFGVRVSPDDMDRNYEFGHLLLTHANTLTQASDDDAGFFLQRALDLHRPRHDPSRAHSCMLLARLCAAVGDYQLRAGNHAAAHALFEEAHRNHAGHGPHVQRLGRSWLYKARLHGVTHTDTPELREALRLLDQAQAMLKTELEDGRNRGGVASRGLAACLHSVGEAHLLQADDRAAAACFREAVALNRQEGAYHGALGDALRNLGDMAEARSAYFKAASLDVKCGRYDYEVSCIAYAASQWDLALQTAEAAARKAPQNALFASQVAMLRARQG